MRAFIERYYFNVRRIENP